MERFPIYGLANQVIKEKFGIDYKDQDFNSKLLFQKKLIAMFRHPSKILQKEVGNYIKKHMKNKGMI